MHIHNVATLGTTAKYKQIQNEIIKPKIPEGQEIEIIQASDEGWGEAPARGAELV